MKVRIIKNECICANHVYYTAADDWFDIEYDTARKFEALGLVELEFIEEEVEYSKINVEPMELEEDDIDLDSVLNEVSVKKRRKKRKK